MPVKGRADVQAPADRREDALDHFVIDELAVFPFRVTILNGLRGRVQCHEPLGSDHVACIQELVGLLNACESFQCYLAGETVARSNKDQGSFRASQFIFSWSAFLRLSCLRSWLSPYAKSGRGHPG